MAMVQRPERRMSKYDILTFNAYFFDLIVTGLTEVPRLGMDLFGEAMAVRAGGTFNTVRAMHRLGLKVGWVCDFGNDLFSQFVLSEIRQEAIDTSLFRMHDHPVRSFSLAFSFAHDRGFISYIDPVEPYDRIPYLLEYRPSILMLCSLEYGAQSMGLVDAAHQIGTAVYMDCQATGASLETPGVVEMLRSVDAFLPNASEARQLTGTADSESALQTLAELAPLVVIKLGSEGALASYRGCRFFSPGIKTDVVDTTGAGDCFNAGFVFGRLQDKGIEACLRLGNICGGLSTTDHGTVATPTLEQIENYL
jgi:sugar/nucleoside kinase (ribokinase family)